MSKKPRSPKQLANDERLRQLAQGRKNTEAPPLTEVQEAPSLATMQQQLNEVMETNALLKAALLKGNQSGTPDSGIGVNKQNRITGEIDKYLIDPSEYADPTKRLAAESRLQPIAFNFNFDLEYEFSIRPYETKTGLNMREPEFTVRLLRAMIDDQGKRVQVLNPVTGKLEDKFIVARRLVFHEDPQAALVIARDNNILIEDTDEKTFLNEMRYLRVRDWLFDYFWPQLADSKAKIREESVGGSIVQIYTKASEDASSIDFDAIEKVKF